MAKRRSAPANHGERDVARHGLPIASVVVPLAFGLVLASIGAMAREAPGGGREPMELRRIMRELGKDMQSVTDAISREDWKRVVEVAPRIASHPQPSLGEKMRILAFAGGDAGRFRRFDEETQQAARSLEQAARRGDGQAVVASFAALQGSCLACHQAFRRSFVEHFHGQDQHEARPTRQ